MIEKVFVVAAEKPVEFVLIIRNVCGVIIVREVFFGRGSVSISGCERGIFLSARPLDRNYYGISRFISLTGNACEFSISARFRRKPTFSPENFYLRDKAYGFPVKSAVLFFEEKNE